MQQQHEGGRRPSSYVARHVGRVCGPPARSIVPVLAVPDARLCLQSSADTRQCWPLHIAAFSRCYIPFPAPSPFENER